MEILGYESDNPLENLTTTSLTLLFTFGFLIIILCIKLFYKLMNNQKIKQDS
jgi:hypothetical protein